MEAMKTEPVGARARENGFTLVELLVVLAILGLLVALAAPRVMKYLGSARSDTARIQIEKLSGVLDLYRLEVGHYPTDQEGLRALVEKPAQAESWNGPSTLTRHVRSGSRRAQTASLNPAVHAFFNASSASAFRSSMQNVQAAV